MNAEPWGLLNCRSVRSNVMPGLTTKRPGFWCFHVRYLSDDVNRAVQDFSDFAKLHGLHLHLRDEVFWTKKPELRLIAVAVDLVTNSARGAVAGSPSFVAAGKRFVGRLPASPVRPIGFRISDWWHGFQEELDDETNRQLADATESE